LIVKLYSVVKHTSKIDAPTKRRKQEVIDIPMKATWENCPQGI